MFNSDDKTHLQRRGGAELTNKWPQQTGRADNGADNTKTIRQRPHIKQPRRSPPKDPRLLTVTKPQREQPAQHLYHLAGAQIQGQLVAQRERTQRATATIQNYRLLATTKPQRKQPAPRLYHLAGAHIKRHASTI